MDKLVVVNARFLTQRVTGVQRFAIEISRHLKRLHPNVLFVSPSNIQNHTITEELDAKVIGSFTGHLWEQIDLPLFLLKQGKPLLINLANTAPLLYGKNIATIHDLAFKVNPSWFSRWFSTYYNFLIPKLASKAKHVVTVSESIKKELVKELQIPAAKVSVIYNAVSPDMLKEATTYSDNTHLQLPTLYLLAVSSLDARKNLIRLIKAFKGIQKPDVHLLIVGSGNQLFSVPELGPLVVDTPNIKIMGYVSDKDLAYLYRNALAFVYPSLYEGFGIPNIEAMKFGCPVITSDLKVTREICAEAALYTNPLSAESMTHAMISIIENKGLREDLKLKGLERANFFCWEKSAEKLLQLILSLPQ